MVDEGDELKVFGRNGTGSLVYYLVRPSEKYPDVYCWVWGGDTKTILMGDFSNVQDMAAPARPKVNLPIENGTGVEICTIEGNPTNKNLDFVSYSHHILPDHTVTISITSGEYSFTAYDCFADRVSKIDGFIVNAGGMFPYVPPYLFLE
jgi:hypothetical protein